MKRPGLIALLCALATLASDAVAHSDAGLPTSGPGLGSRPKGYDSRAVAAARHDFEPPSIKTDILAIADNIDTSTLAIVSKQNPDELVATGKFYSWPAGTAILAKMPKMVQLPAMIEAIMPDDRAEVRAKLKADGAELKL